MLHSGIYLSFNSPYLRKEIYHLCYRSTLGPAQNGSRYQKCLRRRSKTPLGRKCLFIAQVNSSGRGTKTQEKGAKTYCGNFPHHCTHILHDTQKNSYYIILFRYGMTNFHFILILPWTCHPHKFFLFLTC